jgi:hypothetical protein
LGDLVPIREVELQQSEIQIFVISSKGWPANDDSHGFLAGTAVASTRDESGEVHDVKQSPFT